MLPTDKYKITQERGFSGDHKNSNMKKFVKTITLVNSRNFVYLKSIDGEQINNKDPLHSKRLCTFFAVFKRIWVTYR